MSYNPTGTVFPPGFSRVTDEPRQIFYDPFDTTLDVTNLWTTPTVGNSAVLAVNASGAVSMGTGTTASGWSKLTSINSFRPTIPAWIGYSFLNKFPDGAAPTANAYRFWGAGTIATTPTTTAPMTDAVGFEMTTAGKLQAVVYNAGTRTLVADLSSTGTNKQPLDANWHRYIIYIRTDAVFFYLDTLDTAGLVANTTASQGISPSVQTLPISMLAVGGATPPASNTQIQSSGAVVWDTGKNATQIADGLYPFRKVNVGKNGGLSIKGSPITSQSTAFAATVTGNTTGLDVSEAGNASIIIKNTIAASAFATGGVVVFEQSDDNVSWGLMPVLRCDTNLIASTHTLGANSANTSIFFDVGLEGVNYTRVRVTAGVTTNGMTVVVSPGSLAFSPIVGTILNPETTKVIGNVGLIPNTTGGLTTYHLVSAATTNATNIKASTGQLFGWYIYNSNAAARKITFHNSASAPTAGASVFFSIIIPPTSGANVFSETGIAFSAGIGITTTTDLTDAGATAVALNDLNINLFYK